MRVAVVGCGSMGSMHAAVLASLPEVTRLIVVDPDAERAGAVARQTEGRVMDLVEALESADAAVIATPADLHALAVEAAVARGIPALCEKPLTDELVTSTRLVELVERADAHVEVGFQRRHDPGFVEARRRLSDADAGPLRLLRLTAFDPHFAPRPPDCRDGTVPLFLHSAVHDFDLVRWLSGAEVEEVTADASSADAERPDPQRVENAVVTMRLTGGALAVLEASWLHPVGYDIRAEAMTERAHLSVGLSRQTPAHQLDWPDAFADPWAGYLQRFAPAYRAELAAFLAAARGERAPSSTVRDAHEAHRVAVAASRSYVERRPVSMRDIPSLVASEVA